MFCGIKFLFIVICGFMVIVVLFEFIVMWFMIL